MGVRSDEVQTNHVWSRHGSVQNRPATRAYRSHWDAEAGVPYLAAGKSVVWDEGRHLLVSKDTEGKSIESQKAEVRTPLMAVQPMTQQRQWVCCRPHRAPENKMDIHRVIQFESTPNGWNFTVELEATNGANSKMQEVSRDGKTVGTDRTSNT